jgi:uncharacterized membrane protein YeaQ/YmgE (transglycosylase-associated protein family)
MAHHIVGIVGYTIATWVAYRFGLALWQGAVVVLIAAVTTTVKVLLMEWAKESQP